jgi:uncharacterized protein (TIGR00730 family)
VTVRICVFCGSNEGADPAYAEAAASLGAGLAERGIGLVFGGGKVGLMGIVADAVVAGGGEAVGVIPEFLVRAEVAHAAVTELVVVDSMHERKSRMGDLADGFIALPGGYGTIEELVEVLTWSQLGLHAKPVVLLDVNTFYDPLFAFFDAAVEAGLLRPVHRQLAQRAGGVDEAIALATTPTPPTPHKWIDRDPR